MKNGNKYIKANITSSAYDTNCTCSFLVGELIGVVSSEKNGLMPKNGFINLGRGINSGNGDGTDIQNGYAYIFDKDDSGLAGPVFAVQPLDGYSLQIKAQADGSRIKIRTLSSNGWGTWREIQLK